MAHDELCIWMTAGLVAYRLCDRDFDCDRCPFDRAMRGEVPPRHQPPTGWDLPGDRFYHRGHGWALARPGGRVRCGLDVLATRLLAPITAVVLPAVNSRLREGRIAYWVENDETMIPLRAPVSGTVTAVNRDVQRDPGTIARSPYASGWIVEMRCRGALRDRPGLASAGEHRVRTMRELDALHRKVSHLLVPGVEVGPTLADGGEFLTDLRRILGAARHRRLIRAFLD